MKNSFLTLKETCEILRIERHTAKRWIDKGILKATKLGGQWRVTQTEIDRLLSGEGINNG